jgi:hypothetical protein
VRIDDLRRTVGSIRLEARRRIRPEVLAVQAIPVPGAGENAGDPALEHAVVATGKRMGGASINREVHS